MSTYGEDDSSGGFFGGLGGLGGLNNFLTNPLVLASLKMISNNSPRVGQPVNTFEGVDDTLLKSGLARKKQLDEDAAKKAMTAALTASGLSPSEAKIYSANPEAGKIFLDQQKLKKQEAWASQANGTGVPAIPDVPKVSSGGGAGFGAPQGVDQPDDTSTPAIGNTGADVLPKTYGNTAVNAMDFGAPAPPPVTSPQQPQAAPPAQQAPVAETPRGPPPKWLDLPESVQRGLGITPQAPQQQDAPANLDQRIAESAQRLTEQQPATQTQRAVDTYNANRSGQARQDPLPPSLPQRDQGQMQPTAAQTPSAPPQSKSDQAAITYAQNQIGASPAPAAAPPQAPAPQGGQQAPAMPKPAQTATDRALLTREMSKVDKIGSRIQQINTLLRSPYATPHGTEGLKKELDYLYKEYASTDLIKDYNRINEQRTVMGQPFLPLEDYQKSLKAPLVTIDQKQENAYNQKMGTQLAEQNMEIVKDAQKARTKIATLDQLDSLLKSPGLYTGPGGKHVASIAAAAKTFGIDVSNANASQAVESISNQFALELRNPSGGAGMPGAMSDKDREFLQTMPPGLTKLPGGNELIVDYMKRKEQRSIDVEKLRQKYVKTHGKLDEGFYSELSDWSDAHPLFSERDQQTIEKIASTAPGQDKTTTAFGKGPVVWERGPDGRPRPAAQ